MSSWIDEKATWGGAIMGGMLWALLGFILWSACRACAAPERSGLGSASGPDLSPATDRGLAPDVAALSETTAAPSSLGAEARLSGQPASPVGHHPAEEPIPETDLGSSSSGLASLLDQYEFSAPKAEDIAWLTIDSWAQPEFLELTQDEAKELLALDDTMGLKGPGLMTAIAGPLPTQDDCQVAFASQAVQAALREALLWNAITVEVGIRELEAGGTQALRAMKELALRQQTAAEGVLMLELEKATGHEWRLWWRLYRRWAE